LLALLLPSTPNVVPTIVCCFPIVVSVVGGLTAAGVGVGDKEYAED
jgi:hypothetical protein